MITVPVINIHRVTGEIQVTVVDGKAADRRPVAQRACPASTVGVASTRRICVEIVDTHLVTAYLC